MMADHTRQPLLIPAFILCLLGETLTNNTMAEAANFRVLYNFGTQGNADGGGPRAGLLAAADGSFYGTTFGGGAYGLGTVYKLSPDGIETILYSFKGDNKNDGANPEGGLVEGSDSNLYGTSTVGGGGEACFGGGCGTIFKITKRGKESVLYRFTGGDDGINPSYTLAIDSSDNLYGTTFCEVRGCGVVYKVSHNGVETTLYKFEGADDGAYPLGKLVLGKGGSLYGVTGDGGNNNVGTVFKLTTGGIKTTLYAFNGGNDGANPDGGLTSGKNGILYGTTARGGGTGCGGQGCGTVFRIGKEGTETVLHAFDGDDGATSIGELSLDNNQNLYGTTYSGGAGQRGVVFKISRANSFSLLHSFCMKGHDCEDGSYPFDHGGLIMDIKGNLLGTTQEGGTENKGVIFTVSK